MHTREAAGTQLEFAIVSDTHLGKDMSDGSLGVTADPGRGLAKAVREINASPAEFTVFLGDLVDTGARHEDLYAKWLGIAAGLKRPFYAIPGNHDPDAVFRKHIRPQTDYAVDCRGFRFVFFQDSDPKSHDGALTAEQLRWLASQVDEAAARNLRVVLCAHITAHPNKAPDMGWYIRPGGKEFRELMAARPATVVAMLTGHLHCGLRGWSDSGVHEVAVPSTCWNFKRDLSQAGGFAVKEFRPGYVLADLRGDRLALRYKPIGSAALEPVVLQLAAVTPRASVAAGNLRAERGAAGFNE